MNKLQIGTACLVCFLFLASGCGKPAGRLTEASDASGGVSWKIPEGWTKQSERMMRAATYTIPSSGAEADTGECAVFFFGEGQGGDVRMNVERWVDQFEGSPKADTVSREINGISVTDVRIAGTYLSPGGMMMQSQGKKENFVLLGSIIFAPEGVVFFKATGPEGTMEACKPSFDAMVGSLTKQ